MRRVEGLATRKMEILHAIVEEYIETGEPVASRSVARRRGRDLSPASIRNVMADLVEEGFLSQPHTSAGRVPTEKAFRSYVQSLDARRIAARELQRIQSELSGIATLQARVEHTSHLLTELTQSVGIAAAIPTLSQTLDQMELIGLPDQRVLMVVITRDQMVRNRVVQLSEVVSSEELQSIRNYINLEFSGWLLADIREELSRRLEQESAAFDRILQRLAILYSKGLLDWGLSPEIHMDGASNLLGLDLHLTKERMRELFRALEEKKRILQLLDRFLDQPPGEVGVRVGLAEAHPSMSELSLIGLPVTLPNGLSAVVAVLGPMRMNYGRVISAVVHVGQAFQNA
jgi:heat-inducible transcriptional repressor